MKSILQNRTLSIAITISVLAHAVLLAIRFTAPEAFKFKPADPGLEVILVNAKHDRKPLKADALAQANLDGGGNADAGRAKSPLPDMRRSADGDSAKAARRKVEELEQQQRQLLAQMRTDNQFRAAKTNDVERKEPPQPSATDMLDSAKALLRREAEIARSIEDYNKRPKKTQVTPSTREVGYAAYYKALQDRIERFGTLNFPQKDGKKLYGQMVIYIPIYQDGTLYMKEGGARIERTSGNPDLDAAALSIVRRSAPFGRFPDNMRSTGRDDVWEVITRFSFTRDNALETETRGQ
ncbi:MAG TPA: TonB C-terminal domain-containing protein [Oxalicibacterium sp.]|nr:TonB C-terminal domain-containing protein [Oxalicibacterium sp.]